MEVPTTEDLTGVILKLMDASDKSNDTNGYSIHETARVCVIRTHIREEGIRYAIYLSAGEYDAG